MKCFSSVISNSGFRIRLILKRIRIRIRPKILMRIRIRIQGVNKDSQSKIFKKKFRNKKIFNIFPQDPKLTKMLRKWAFFSMNLKKEKSTRQKTCQIVSEIGIFSQDPDPDPHFLRIRIRTGQKQADPGGSGSETLVKMSSNILALSP